MSLIFMDSFDHYETADLTRKYSSVAFATINTSTGRRSGGALLCNSGSARVDIAVPANDTYIVGAAVRKPNLNAAAQIFTFFETGIQHVLVRIEPGGRLAAYRGSTANLLTLSDDSFLRENDWFYIEAEVVIGDGTSGSVIVRVNGVQAFDTGGVDTQNAGTAVCNIIRLAGAADFDDLVIMDDGGSQNNAFLGDVQIDALLPDGDGSTNNWTATGAGATNADRVDESPAIDDDTTFVDTSTDTDQDLYTFGNLPSITGGSTVHAAQAVGTVRTDSGNANVQLLARPASTTANGGTHTIGSAYEMVTEVWEDNPDGGAWTDISLDGSEFGIEKVA